MSDSMASFAQLLDRDLVCVDLETTGGNAGWHRIMEIGLVTVDRDGSLSEWSTLVNPGVRVPASIARFTGIDDEMLTDAPTFESVHRELLERLDGRLFIAHNARFDYGFIKAELRRLDVSWSARTLCTVKLSRRLYPQYPRHNLDALIERHKLGCEARHRALGDARVLRDLLSVYARELEPDYLSRVAQTVLAEVAVPAQLPTDLPDELPESPGVYRFFGEGNALLYVGKSKNLRARVLAHFNASASHSRERVLATQVRRVEWEETAGELGALLREARAVKVESPLHNRRLRDAKSSFTLSLSPAATGQPVRVTIDELTAVEARADVELYGVFRRERDAKQALEQIARAQNLCLKAVGLEQTPGSCFGFQLGRCRGVCVGKEPTLLHDTRLRLALSASRLKSWPYAGRIAIRECDWKGSVDLHVFDQWRYLGTVHQVSDIAELVDPKMSFDIDVYRLLTRHLAEVSADSIIQVLPCKQG